MKYLRTLAQSEIHQHIEQTHSLWEEGFSVSERVSALQRRLQNASLETFSMSGFIDENGTLIASLKRYFFRVVVGGKPTPCIGLGAIFTEQNHRKKGLAAQLIEIVLSEARELQGCGAAILYSDIGPSYYQRFGFVEVPAFTWRKSVLALPSGRSLETRKAIPKDITQMTAWYIQGVKGFLTYSERTETTWRLFREINHVEQDLVLMDVGKEVGFLSVSFNPEGKFLWLEEWFAPEVDPSLVWATVRRIAEAKSCTEVRGWKLPSIQVEGADIHAREKAIPMIAPLRAEAGFKLSDLDRAYFASPDHF